MSGAREDRNYAPNAGQSSGAWGAGAILEWRALDAPLGRALHDALSAALDALAATRSLATCFRVVDLQTADEQTFRHALRLDMDCEHYLPKLNESLCLARLFGRGSIYAVFDGPYVVALMCVRSNDVVVDLMALAVDQAYQHQRVGSAMVAAVVGVLADRPLTAMVIEGNYRSLCLFLRAGFELSDDEHAGVWHLRWTGAEWPPPRSAVAMRWRVDVTTPSLCNHPNLQAELRVRLPHIDVYVHTEPPLDSRREQVLLIGKIGDCQAYARSADTCLEIIADDMRRLDRTIERLRSMHKWTHVCLTVSDLCRHYEPDLL